MHEPQAVPEANSTPQGASVDTNPPPQGVTVGADAVPQGAGVPVAANPAAHVDAPDYRAMYENLRRENEILRHNAEITQRAPVQGVSGGGAVATPVDDFTRG
ncbi:MAG: hypothetical protein IKR84_06590, partial [Oscillibacter sp.]|nr:hypothetical protein [Oscillibacter sp.]